jgi:negative regulator of sigma E activity
MTGMNEKLSAFVDGEASARETAAVLRQLGRDAAYRRALSRQAWLHETLRGEQLPLDDGFADRLAARIDAEDGASDRVIEMQPRAARFRRHWLGPMTGFATAASIVTAVVLLTNVGQDAPETQGQLAQQQTPPPAAVSVASATQRPVSVNASAGLGEAAARLGARRSDSSHWTVSDPAIEDRLNGYLLEHNGLARGYGLSSATPSFVRVATYGQGSGR